MANDDIVVMQTPDGKKWDVPRSQVSVATTRFGAKPWVAPPVPGPAQRGLTSLAGVPEETNINPLSAGFYEGTGDWRRYLGAGWQAISGLNPVPAMQETRDVAWKEMMNDPSLTNKLGAGLNYLEGYVPYVGPMAARAGSQFGRDDIAGGLGSSVSAGLQAAGMAKGGRPLVENIATLANRPKIIPKLPGFESVVGIGETAEQIAREESQSRLAKVKEENATTLRDAQEKVRQANEKATLAKGAELQANKVEASKARNEYETAVRRVAQREQMIEGAKDAVEPIADALPKIAEQARAVGSALYPDIEGTRDADVLRAGLQAQVDAHLRGAGKVPTAIANAISELTPKTSTERAISDVESKASIYAKKLLDSGVSQEDTRSVLTNQGYLPRQVTTIMDVARGVADAVDDRKVPFQKIHGIYTELNRAAYRAIGDERAALQGGRDYFGGIMQAMADMEKKGDRFAVAQRNWADVQNTFYNTDALSKGGSPIAHALKAYDPILRKLRPEFVQDALSGEREYQYARRMLAKHPELVRALDKMHFAMNEAEKLPSKAPEWEVKTGMKEVEPLKLEPIPGPKDLELKPEEEFDRFKWRIDALREKAKQFSGMSRYEVNPSSGFKIVPFRRFIARLLADPATREAIAKSPSAMRRLAQAGIIDVALVPRPAPGDEDK